MSARLIVVLVSLCLLVTACGTSSGLQIENGGTTTRLVKPAGSQPRVDGLDAVAFPSTSRGWAGGTGAIIATTDGGSTWTQQYDGPADIRSLEFADEQHGWAVASTSVLRTTDGGARWSPVTEPEGLLLTSVTFTSAEEGWGIAYPAGTVGERALGTLVSTTDGGSSWSVADPHVADSVCVSGGELIAGAGSKVLDSRDGGATWSTLLDAESGPITQWFTATVQCPDLQSIWVLFQGGVAAGSEGYAAYASADAGVGWQPVVVAPMLVGSVPAFANVTSLDAYSGPFAAVSASEAIFLGSCPPCDPQHVTVLRTRNAGARWDRRVVNGFYPTGLAFADPDHGWMTTLVGGVEGRRSAILATTDGGRSWHPVYPS
jgi:photosystem II stability/assembly factor-like uncharacterized protein